MVKQLTLTWIVLVVLSLSLAGWLWMAGTASLKPGIILLISGLKFIGVAWFFLGLRHAHPVWRVTLGLFVTILFIIVSIM